MAIKTVAERKAQVEEAAQGFADHLVTAQGAQLEPAQRWLVCAAAIKALECSGCANLPNDTCLKPGTTIYPLLDDLKHDRTKEEEMFAENQIQVITTIDYRNNNDLKHDLTKEEEMFAEKQIQVITTIVHSIVNHQARIDVGWHDASLEAIKDAKIIPSECTESQLQSALVEIITLTTLAHHYNVAFILMGLKGGWELPSLADVKDAPKLQEPRFDPEKLLKEGQTLQCDDTVIRSPYYTYFQVDKSSGTFTCLPKENQDLLFAYTNIMMPIILSSICFMPLDGASRAEIRSTLKFGQFL